MVFVKSYYYRLLEKFVLESVKLYETFLVLNFRLNFLIEVHGAVVRSPIFCILSELILCG